MELIASVFSNIWTCLDTYQVPIVNVSIKTFLLSLFILNITFGLLNFFLGKRGDSKGD